MVLVRKALAITQALIKTVLPQATLTVIVTATLDCVLPVVNNLLIKLGRGVAELFCGVLESLECER